MCWKVLSKKVYGRCFAASYIVLAVPVNYLTGFWELSTQSCTLLCKSLNGHFSGRRKALIVWQLLFSNLWSTLRANEIHPAACIHRTDVMLVTMLVADFSVFSKLLTAQKADSRKSHGALLFSRCSSQSKITDSSSVASATSVMGWGLLGWFILVGVNGATSGKGIRL